MTKQTFPGRCSVVCTTYNHAAFSERSIQSIFDQTYRNIEIVIVDDGSRDDNVAIMREKLSDSPFPFSLIDQVNTGNIGLNVNRGLAVAEGEYVCLISLDDLLLPDCIESKIALLQQDQNLMLVANTSCKEIDDADIMISEMIKTPLYGKNYTTAAEMLEHEYVEIATFYMQGAVLRSKIIDIVGGYDVDMIGDDLILRTKIWQYMLLHPELTFRLQDTPGFVYRKHDQNIHRNTLRQLRTVIEWRDRFFPDRPLPDLFTRWAFHFFGQCIAHQRNSELKAALEYSPEIRARYLTYIGSWKFRRRAFKNYIKRKLGVLPK